MNQLCIKSRLFDYYVQFVVKKCSAEEFVIVFEDVVCGAGELCCSMKRAENKTVEIHVSVHVIQSDGLLFGVKCWIVARRGTHSSDICSP